MRCLRRIASIHLHNLHLPSTPCGDRTRLLSYLISGREAHDAAWINYYESEEVQRVMMSPES